MMIEKPRREPPPMRQFVCDGLLRNGQPCGARLFDYNPAGRYQVRIRCRRCGAFIWLNNFGWPEAS